MPTVFVTGSFDDLRSSHIRFLEAASKLDEVQVWLWSDESVRALTGKPPQFPAEEHLYLVQAIRYVSLAAIAPEEVGLHALPKVEGPLPAMWAVEAQADDAQKRAYCETHGLGYHVFTADELTGFSEVEFETSPLSPQRKKVRVTGCYDWFHSGHVRFFEEAPALGDLYVVAGSDRNVRLMKGEGHPLFPQAERRYVIQSMRYVKQALISSGEGWMDAEPEIDWLKPDIYVVNEDGDKPEKREFSAESLPNVISSRLEMLLERTSHD